MILGSSSPGTVTVLAAECFSVGYLNYRSTAVSAELCIMRSFSAQNWTILDRNSTKTTKQTSPNNQQSHKATNKTTKKTKKVRKKQKKRKRGRGQRPFFFAPGCRARGAVNMWHSGSTSILLHRRGGLVGRLHRHKSAHPASVDNSSGRTGRQKLDICRRMDAERTTSAAIKVGVYRVRAVATFTPFALLAHRQTDFYISTTASITLLASITCRAVHCCLSTHHTPAR